MTLSFILITLAGVIGVWLIAREEPGTLPGQAQEPHRHPQREADRTITLRVGAGSGRAATVYDQEVEDLAFSRWWAER